MWIGSAGESQDKSGLPGLGIPVPAEILTMAISPELQRQFVRILCNTPRGRMQRSSEGGGMDDREVQFDFGIA